MKKYKSLFIIPLFLIFLKVHAYQTIVLFFQSSCKAPEKMAKQLQKGKTIAHHTITSITKHTPVSGITVLYNGYVAISDYDGEILLPRKHMQPKVTLLVTTQITPVFMLENTVHHWELVPGVDAAMYSIERVQDEATQQESWQVSSMNVPENNEIPVATIIIIAQPKAIEVPTGMMPTLQSPNLVIPPIYVIKGKKIVPNNIHALDIRFLFRPVQLKNNKEPLRLTTHILS